MPCICTCRCCCNSHACGCAAVPTCPSHPLRLLRICMHPLHKCLSIECATACHFATLKPLAMSRLQGFTLRHLKRMRGWHTEQASAVRAAGPPGVVWVREHTCSCLLLPCGPSPQAHSPQRWPCCGCVPSLPLQPTGCSGGDLRQPQSEGNQSHRMSHHGSTDNMCAVQADAFTAATHQLAARRSMAAGAHLAQLLASQPCHGSHDC